LNGQFGVDIAQIFVGHAIAGIVCHRLVQRNARTFVLAIPGIKHCQVVIGFRQIRIVFSELDQQGDCLGRFALLRQDDGFREAHLRIARIEHQHAFHPFQCLGKLPTLHEPCNIRLLIDRAGLQIAGNDTA
jgi:hypothetical protein